MDHSWPGWDEPPVVPVVINAARPGRNRPRLNTEYAFPRQRFYPGPNDQLFVPAGAGHHRASSFAGQRPAQVIINNDNNLWDEHYTDGRRPRSSHGPKYYYDDDYYDDRDTERHRSRVRVRTPSPYMDYETQKMRSELEDLKKKEADRERKKHIEEELRIKQAKEEAERHEKLKEEKELKKRAIEEYKIKEEERKHKEKREKEKQEEEFDERMRKTLWANGYSDEQIERMMRKARKKGHSRSHSRGDSPGSSSSKALTLGRPTYVKVSRTYIDPETLDTYDLPWEWDDTDPDYIIVKQWIPEREQDLLFEHTRKLREKKQITYTTTELRKEHDQMLLVRRKEPRKKSPAGKTTSWFLT